VDSWALSIIISSRVRGGSLCILAYTLDLPWYLHHPTPFTCLFRTWFSNSLVKTSCIVGSIQAYIYHTGLSEDLSRCILNTLDLLPSVHSPSPSSDICSRFSSPIALVKTSCIGGSIQAYIYHTSLSEVSTTVSTSVLTCPFCIWFSNCLRQNLWHWGGG